MSIGADGDIGAFDEAVIVFVEAERAADDGVEGKDVAEELERTRELSTTTDQHKLTSPHTATVRSQRRHSFAIYTNGMQVVFHEKGLSGSDEDMLINIPEIPVFSNMSSQIQSRINTFCIYIISLVCSMVHIIITTVIKNMSNKLQAVVSFTQTF